ncbi:hypothetical protein ACLKA6_001432 [Drosophila palustris]
MLKKAFLYAEYQTVANRGPRLGPMLHRVVGVGALYFLLVCVESYLRITKIKNDRSDLLVTLAVLDTEERFLTRRALRLRRSMIKLLLYI